MRLLGQFWQSNSLFQYYWKRNNSYENLVILKNKVFSLNCGQQVMCHSTVKLYKLIYQLIRRWSTYMNVIKRYLNHIVCWSRCQLCVFAVFVIAWKSKDSWKKLIIGMWCTNVLSSYVIFHEHFPLFWWLRNYMTLDPFRFSGINKTERWKGSP